MKERKGISPTIFTIYEANHQTEAQRVHIFSKLLKNDRKADKMP